VLSKTGVSYWDSKNDHKENPKSAKETIALSNISDVHCIKNQGQEGFMFEIKSSSGQVKTQHLCNTDEERQKWVYAVMKTRSEPNSMPEEESSEEDSAKVKTKPKHTKQKSKPKDEPVSSQSSPPPTTAVDTKDKSENKRSKKSEDRSVKKNEPQPVIANESNPKPKKESSNNVIIIKSPRKDEMKKPDKPSVSTKEKDKDKSEDAEPVDYTNQTGTMVVTKSSPSISNSSAKKDDKKDQPSYINASGTMVVTAQNLQAALNSAPESNGVRGEAEEEEEDYANSTGTMVVAKTMKVSKEERYISPEEIEKLTTEELQKWHDTKLEKRYKKECDRILRKWKEEKSAVLYAMRKKEIDVIEQKYQQLQLDLERELQEKKEIMNDGGL